MEKGLFAQQTRKVKTATRVAGWFFLELDDLINRVTLKKIRHEEIKKKDKRTGSLGLALPTQHSSMAATSPSIPSTYCLSASSIPASEPATDMIT